MISASSEAPVESPGAKFRRGGWVSRLLIAWGVVGVLLQSIAMIYAGIGWDGRMDAGQSVVIREVIPALPAGTDLAAAYDMIHFTAEFYGILIPQLADLLHNTVAGTSGMLTLNDLSVYRWQGLVNLLIAAVASAALALAVSRSLRSRLAGAYIWSLLVFTPILFGTSYVNIKDVPVASGLTLITAGLILVQVGDSDHSRWFLGGVAVTLGGCVGVASRPGLWPVFLFLPVATIGVTALIRWRQGRIREVIPMSTVSAIGLVVTLAFVWWTNPFGRMALFPWLWDSFSVMRSYPWEATVRTAGQDVLSTEAPWWYVPAWLFAQLPVLTLLVVLLGLGLIVWTTWRRGPGRELNVPVSYAPILLQGIVLPAGIVASGAILYDATRHVLFVFAPLIAISAFAIAWIERRPEILQVRGAHVAVSLSLLVVGLSSWATLRWFPYSYAFINPIAGINHAERDWELDYWGVTSFEGVDRLQQAGEEYVAVLPSEEPALIFGGGARDLIEPAAGDGGYGLYVFRRWDASIGDCESLFTIERDGHILGEGAHCVGSG